MKRVHFYRQNLSASSTLHNPLAWCCVKSCLWSCCRQWVAVSVLTWMPRVQSNVLVMAKVFGFENPLEYSKSLVTQQGVQYIEIYCYVYGTCSIMELYWVVLTPWVQLTVVWAKDKYPTGWKVAFGWSRLLNNRFTNFLYVCKQFTTIKLMRVAKNVASIWIGSSWKQSRNHRVVRVLVSRGFSHSYVFSRSARRQMEGGWCS